MAQSHKFQPLNRYRAERERRIETLRAEREVIALREESRLRDIKLAEKLEDQETNRLARVLGMHKMRDPPRRYKPRNILPVPRGSPYKGSAL